MSECDLERGKLAAYLDGEMPRGAGGGGAHAHCGVPGVRGARLLGLQLH